MLELLAINIGFGVLFALLGRHFNGTWVNGVNLFWLSWLVLLISCMQSVATNPSFSVPDSSIHFVRLAFFGAAGGSLLGILLAGKRSEGSVWKAYQQLREHADFLLRYLVPAFLVSMSILGIFHFVERWSHVDFDIRRILEVRIAFLNQGFSLFSRLGSYAAMLGLFVMMLQGTRDASSKPDWSKIAALWLVNAPHGLAFGGRGWTVAPLLIYLFAYIFTWQSLPRRNRGPVPFRITGFLALGFWAFVVLGTLRSTENTESLKEVATPTNWDVGQQNMLSNWIGASLIAAGPHSEFVATLEPAWGDATFEYFTGKAESWGLIERRPLRNWSDWIAAELMRDGEYGYVWCVPPTVIPYLILDYGEYGMPIALGILIALLNVAAARLTGRSVLSQFVAFASVNSIFSTIQILNVFAAVNVAPFIITALIQLGLNHLRSKIEKPISDEVVLEQGQA